MCLKIRSIIYPDLKIQRFHQNRSKNWVPVRGHVLQDQIMSIYGSHPSPNPIKACSLGGPFWALSNYKQDLGHVLLQSRPGLCWKIPNQVHHFIHLGVAVSSVSMLKSTWLMILQYIISDKKFNMQEKSVYKWGHLYKMRRSNWIGA